MGAPSVITPTNTFPPGTVLGKYEIVRLVGTGGMSAVYEGRHVDLGRRVAIKTLKPEHAAQPGVRARFLREGIAASKIRHRNVADVFDVDEQGGVVYLVMEFLEGEDLLRHIRRRGPLPEREALEILLPVMSAIAAVHDEGVIHRDLKPANIFLAQTRHGVEPKVVDFGISRVISDSSHEQGWQTNEGDLLGTPRYMAPEQIQNSRESGPWSDQYSLGVILYQMVTGALPCDGANVFQVMQAIVEGRLTPPRALRPDLSPTVEAVLQRALAYDPAQRFPSVADMARALGATPALLAHPGAAPVPVAIPADDPSSPSLGGTAREVTAPSVAPPAPFPWLAAAFAVASFGVLVGVLSTRVSTARPAATPRPAISAPVAIPAPVAPPAPVAIPAPAPAVVASDAGSPEAPAPSLRAPAPRTAPVIAAPRTPRRTNRVERTATGGAIIE